MDDRPTEGQAGAGGYPRAKGDRSNRSTLKRKVNYLGDRNQTDVTARSDEIEQGREGLQSCELGKGVRRGRVQVIRSQELVFIMATNHKDIHTTPIKVYSV